MKDRELLQLIAALDWANVEGMVPPQAQNILLDIVFHTKHGSITITGKDHALTNGEEAFSVSVYEHVKSGWWAEISTNWRPINLIDYLQTRSLSCLMTGPRHLHFFSDPRLRNRLLPPEEFLDNCSAIEFVKYVDGCEKRFVIKASNNTPCALDIAIHEEDCERLLNGLEDIIM